MLVSVAVAPTRTIASDVSDDCPGHATAKNAYPVHKVLRVTDGDTLVLTDNRRIRLIGLNALELRSKNQDERRWAEAASLALSEAINGQPVTLIAGRENQDRHGRMLAHVLVDSGANAAQTLIENGLALAIAVGRNTRCAERLIEHENHARLERRGIWRNPGDWFVDSSRLKGNERGFHVVESHVKAIGGSSRSPTLLLSNELTVKLGKAWPHKSSPLSAGFSDNLLGKRVELRGWLSAAAGRVNLTLHHPANLRVLDN